MGKDTLRANVQYGDYVGSVAADGHDQRGLQDLMQRYAIDKDRYFAFGLDIYIGETRGNELEKPNISILAVDTQIVGGGVDAIQQYADDHNGVLPYIRFDVEIDLEDILRYFKQINIVLSNSHIKRVQTYHQEDV